MVLPIAYIALHSVPSADDFFNAVLMSDLRESHGGSLFAAAIDTTAEGYWSVGGYFFSLFLNRFVTPLLRAGVVGVRAFNLFGGLFFFAALYAITRSIVGDLIAKDRSLIWGVFFAVTFCLINSYGYREVYAWYCVVVAYIVPIAVSFCMVAFYLTALRSGKPAFAVLAALFGFLASGTSLNVVVLNCGMAVLLLIVGIRRFGKPKMSICITAIIILGALINVAAPGNFARHDAIATDYNFVEALVVSVKLVVKRGLYFLTSTSLVAIAAVIMVAIFVKMDENSKAKCSGLQLVVTAFLFFVGAVATDFPVLLGYSNITFPDRALFVQDMVMQILILIWFGQLAVFLKAKMPSFEFSRGVIAAIAVVCLLACCLPFVNRSPAEWTTPRMIGEIADGSISSFSETELGIMDEIEGSSDEDVVIDHQEALPGFVVNIGLTADKDYWVNVSVAEYYGKDSVVLDAPVSASE